MNPLKLESILEMANVLASQSDFHEILRIVTEKASDLLKAETTLIMMINPRTRETIKTVYKETREQYKQRSQFIHTYFCGWVITHDSGFYSENIQEDARFEKELLKNMTLKSVMCTPLRVEGVIIGVLLVLNQSEGQSFYNDDFEYLEKFTAVASPFLRNVQKIEAYFSQKIPEDTLLIKYKVCGLLGKSKPFVELLRAIEAAAGCDARVLLQGKSGTGKELIAKAIHDFSKRNSHKFVAIDCGAISENLIESELFGHVKGAFTGAMNSRTGLFEEANNGTLFMDEISNLPMELQAKLLRVLQENEIRPLGSNTIRKVNVRIISASSEPLKELVNKQKFREDLFYRLMVYPVIIPSLEERQEDIPLLANHFIKLYAKQQNKQVKRFDESIIDFIKHHDWTGNIRELENFVERVVTLASKNQTQIDVGLLPPEFRYELKMMQKNRNQVQKTRSLAEILNTQEKQIVHQTLVNHKWNQSSAAKALGIDESTLRYKMKKYKIKKV
jgi:transcriptional regulator with GAF, ATPase, and Fis domain